MYCFRAVVPILISGMLVLHCSLAGAQDYPNRPLRIVVPAVGSGGDFSARLLSPGLSARLGQPIIVDNRGSGIIAVDTVAKAAPDGYSMTLQGATLWVAPLLVKTPYDLQKDFAPVSLITKEVFIVSVHPSVPATSLKELIALAKAKPGTLNYSSAGTGGSSHLATELFKSAAGINIVHVPYKGGGAATTALVAGEVQLMLADASVLATHVKAGKLRALAVTSAQPSALAPGLPTVAASGVPGFEAGGTTGMWVPAKTPESIINRLNQEVTRVLSTAEIKERYLTAGAEVVGSSPDQFATFVRSDLAKMGKVIKDAGIKGE